MAPGTTVSEEVDKCRVFGFSSFLYMVALSICLVVIPHLKRQESTIPRHIERAAAEKLGIAEICRPAVDVIPLQSNVKGPPSCNESSRRAGSDAINILRPYHTRL